MLWIKICGITNKEDAAAACKSGADSIGFVFYKDSPRSIDEDIAEKIIFSIRENNWTKLSFTGVFVNEKIKRVAEISKRLSLDYLQFSGVESEDYLKLIKDNMAEKIKIIKTVRVKECDNFIENDDHAFKNSKNLNLYKKDIIEEIIKLKGLVDFVLLDSFKKNSYGGTGVIFNWEIAENLGIEFPIILSGGLDEDNIAMALNTVKPFGVDVSSRLEIYPGKKDKQKVNIFINKVRFFEKDQYEKKLFK
jgi:Phosphoribosylanthranilate isomerase